MWNNSRRGKTRRLPDPLLGAILFLFLVASLPTANSQTAGDAPAPSLPVQHPVITLAEAIHRAEANEPIYAAASAESRASALDRAIARGGLLPSVVYHNQATYTQPTSPAAGSQSSQIFIANNAVHEYASQASINERLGLNQIAGVRRADAASALAAAQLEVARRGLISAVTGLFYGSLAADHKLLVADRARQEADDFTSLTTKREQAREAAHADVVKAQLVAQQRQRDLQDAKLAAEKARLELGVLLFPDPRTPYTLQAADTVPQLISREDVEQAAAKNNPELKSALSTLAVSNADMLSARAAYLPDLGVNFTYGIDAPQFAVNGPDKTRNLGYSASVTLDIPVWDWFSTQHKVKQAGSAVMPRRSPSPPPSAVSSRVSTRLTQKPRLPAINLIRSMPAPPRPPRASALPACVTPTARPRCLK